MAKYTQLPSDDSFVNSASSSTNYGTEEGLVIGGWGNFHMIGIKFDISSLPAKAKSAKIFIYRAGGQANQLTSTRWRRIESSWDEGTLTYDNRPTGMQNNDGTLVSLPAAGNWFELDITTLYNQWKDGTYTNYGVAINGNATDYNEAVTTFNSKEYTTDTSKRPYLEVEEVELTDEGKFFQLF